MNAKRMCGLLAVWVMGLPAVSTADVFINEIHYDNAGTDVGEAIEVVATAGEDLSQYRLHFYNGSNGALSTSTSPAIQSLPAGSPGTCGGTVSISVLYPNQIENGAPDGVALEGPGGTLVQFLSWEGAFTGTAGIANGVASTDIGVSESSSAPVGTSLQLGGGPGGSYADFAWNASADQTFGTCNTGQSFGPTADIPPYLADSFPEDGEDFPINASLVLTFSEPVNVTGDWFEMQCDLSGSYTPANTSVTGGPAIYELTPDTPFQVDDDCELTLEPTLITDLGSEAYELEGPNVLTFTTIAPPPPALVSTVPLQGTNNFPSAGDLRAMFSEPVTASPGAFSLTCDESTGIALDPDSADGGITWVIGTGTALEAGDACTFAIAAAFIESLDGRPLEDGAAIAFTVADFGNVGAYYENVNLASPEQLRCSLYETIKGHIAIPYFGAGTNTWTVLNLADEDPVDTSMILDTFRNQSINKIPGGEGPYNREHTWPRSYGLGQTATPGPATDTHMLHLTEVDYNTERGNRPFGICTGGCTKLPTVHNHGIGGTSDADSNWVKAPDGADGTFEPWNHIKGNMARAVMYMAIRYKGENGEPNLELTDDRSLYRTRPNNSNPPSGTYYMGDLSALLAWNQIDAPDARELERNQIVSSFQENRNPFIDHPEWAKRELFEAARANPCQLNQSAPVAENDSYAMDQDESLSPIAADGVLQNDSDEEFDAAGTVPAGWFTLTAERLTTPVNGTLLFSADGSFTYTPATGFCGTDSFTYRTSDGVRWSQPATVTIAVGSDCDGEPQEPEIFADGFEQG